LVPSEETDVNNLAAFFKKYLEVKPDGHLTLEGHADVRGGKRYNEALSQRRADRIKNALVDQSVSASTIDTQALGKSVELSRQEVLDLVNQNPNLSPEEKKRITHRIRMYWLANNRRVDIKLSPTNEESHHYYPYNSPDVKELSSTARPHHGRRRAAKKQAPAPK
jgi:outer membrane protein OmpA-like peptidoglycan-associated protein